MATRKVIECRLLSVVFACFAILAGKQIGTGGGLWTTFYGSLVALSLLLAVTTWHMARLQPADSHTPITLALQYLLMQLLMIKGGFVFRKMQKLSLNVKDVQEKLLMGLLRENADTAYGRRRLFSRISNREEYTSAHPLTTYADYKPYIDEIIEGKDNVLTKDPVIYMATSSGTTGKNKLLPITHHMKGPAAMKVGPLMYYFMNEKTTLTLQRVFILSYKSPVSACGTSGLPCGPVTSHMSRYVPFAIAPRAAYQITQEDVALRVHAVFALSEPEVGHIEALMATLVYAFWMYVEYNWPSICDDIERGSISLDVNLPEVIASELNSHLKANPRRARELREQFSRGFHGVTTRVWPHFRFVRMLATGGFAHYAKRLREHHMAGVTQVSQAHAASEGFFGFNMSADPDDMTLTALIDYGFLEFITEASTGEDQPETVFADQVLLGQCYEMVLTSPMGLYRYRSGDVIKVVSFLHQCPVYEFQYRLGQVLNLYWEKTPEAVIYKAVEQAAALCGDHLVDYTTTEDLHIPDKGRSGTKKHYVLFIELQKDGCCVSLDEEQRRNFDNCLRDNFDLYDSLRHSGSIGPMEVVTLRDGTFRRLKAFIIAQSQNQQFKMARVMRQPERLEFLLKNKI